MYILVGGHSTCADKMHSTNKAHLSAVIGLQVLEAQGQTIVSPSDRSQLHPLLIPLARHKDSVAKNTSQSENGGILYTCLLRWPDITSRVSS